uniref:Uncharacterized protein n=1 Tax=Triticum urartu TaxID=4572 RepID=A0A8R7QYZ3_TRIUA
IYFNYSRPRSSHAAHGVLRRLGGRQLAAAARDETEPLGGGRFEHGLRVGVHGVGEPRPHPGGDQPRPVSRGAPDHCHGRRPEPPRPHPRHHQPRRAEPKVALHPERHERRHHQRRAARAQPHRLRPLAALRKHPLVRFHPVHQLLVPLLPEHLGDCRGGHRRHVGERGGAHRVHDRLPGRVGDDVAKVVVDVGLVVFGGVEAPAAVDEPRHAAVRVGAAHGRGEQLPDVRGEGLEPRDPAGGAAGRPAEAVDVCGVHDVVAAHEGRGKEGVGEGAGVVAHELGVQRRAVPRRRAGPEEGGAVVVGLPREAARDEHLGPGVGQRGEPVAVDEQVVGAPGEREPTAREPDELQRQREPPLERQLDAPQRGAGVGKVHVRERRVGVRDHELGPFVAADDVRHAGGGAGHDAAGEGVEAGEEGRERGARGRGHGREARGGRRVDGDEEDVEGAEDEVQVGDREHRRESPRRVGGLDERPREDLDGETLGRRHPGCARPHAAQGGATRR